MPASENIAALLGSLAGGSGISGEGGSSGTQRDIAGVISAASGLGSRIGITPEERMGRQAMNLQLRGQRQQMKRQNQLFDMLLGGSGGSGGLLGGLFGNLMPGGPGGGGGAGTISQPGFQEGPGGGNMNIGSPPAAGQPGNYGAGQRAALAEQFRTAQANALGSLEARGLGGSSLVGPAMGGVARQQSLASGELEDRLFREQLQFRAAERAPLFGLLGQLLGSVGV